MQEKIHQLSKDLSMELERSAGLEGAMSNLVTKVASLTGEVRALGRPSVVEFRESEIQVWSMTTADPYPCQLERNAQPPAEHLRLAEERLQEMEGDNAALKEDVAKLTAAVSQSSYSPSLGPVTTTRSLMLRRATQAERISREAANEREDVARAHT